MEAKDIRFNVKISIVDVGCWLLKSKVHGMVMQNCGLILDGLVKVDAELQFRALSHFSTSLNGVMTFEDALSKGVISKSGDIRPVKMLYHALSNLRGAEEAEAEANDWDAADMLDDDNSSGHGSDSDDEVDTSIELSSSSRDQHRHEIPASTTPAAGISARDRVIKEGWLYKQTDLLRRWRCRYFKVYPLRCEYFVDPQLDTKPRGSFSLAGATVRPARQCQVNGVKDHWCVHVELRDKSQSFKVASEQTGDVGEADATTWVQVFQMAVGNDIPIMHTMNNSSTPASQASEITPQHTHGRRRHASRTPGQEQDPYVMTAQDDVTPVTNRVAARRRGAATESDLKESKNYIEMEGYLLIARGATASMVVMNVMSGNIFISSTAAALCFFALTFIIQQGTAAPKEKT